MRYHGGHARPRRRGVKAAALAAHRAGRGGGRDCERRRAVPTTLTVAAGSYDGEAARVMSAIASRLVKNSASIRLKIADSGTALEAAKAFAAGKVDLAIVRADAGDLPAARTVVLVTHGVVMIIVPPGSAIDSMEGLKGKTVGVLGGDVNRLIVEVLTRSSSRTLCPARPSKRFAPSR
jgi:TRAP-type uncharacterized transport system substrate-binding protein